MEIAGTGGDGGSGSHTPGGSSSHGKPRASPRERTQTSCTECRRRKQKCNQEQPCSNCARRFPPPVCEYTAPKSRRTTGSPSHFPPATSAGDVPIPVLGERPVITPRIPQDSPATGYGSEATWWGVAITTNFPGQSWAQPGAFAGHGQWNPAWTPSAYVSHDPVSSSFSPALKPASFRPELGLSTDSPSGVPAPGIEQPQFQQHTAGPLDTRIMVPQQFFGAGEPSASTSGSGGQAQASYGSTMGQMQWAGWSGDIQGSMGDLSGVPVAPSRINQELVHIFANILSRFKTSLDGNTDASNPYIRYYVPWCLSSPLLAHVALCIAACFLTETNQLDHAVAMDFKQRAIEMLNEHLAGDDKASDESIAAVVQLILDEWYRGERRDLTAHLRGLREMTAARGGISGLGLGGLLGKLAFSADRCICLSLETQPFLPSSTTPSPPESGSLPFRVPHNTPLVAGKVSFAACSEALRLHPVTADILDDVGFLIATVLKLPKDASEQEEKKLEATAKWIHDRILSLPPRSPPGLEEGSSQNRDSGDQPGGENQQNFLHQTIRLTSLIYTNAIISREPLSQSCSPTQFLEAWMSAGRIPLTTWKGMLGVFLWLVLPLAPTAARTQHARFVKSMLNIACTQLAVESWETAEQAMERMCALQLWLAGGASAVTKQTPSQELTGESRKGVADMS